MQDVQYSTQSNAVYTDCLLCAHQLAHIYYVIFFIVLVTEHVTTESEIKSAGLFKVTTLCRPTVPGNVHMQYVTHVI